MIDFKRKEEFKRKEGTIWLHFADIEHRDNIKSIRKTLGSLEIWPQTQGMLIPSLWISYFKR